MSNNNIMPWLNEVSVNSTNVTNLSYHQDQVKSRHLLSSNGFNLIEVINEFKQRNDNIFSAEINIKHSLLLQRTKDLLLEDNVSLSIKDYEYLISSWVGFYKIISEKIEENKNQFIKEWDEQKKNIEYESSNSLIIESFEKLKDCIKNFNKKQYLNNNQVKKAFKIIEKDISIEENVFDLFDQAISYIKWKLKDNDFISLSDNKQNHVAIKYLLQQAQSKKQEKEIYAHKIVEEIMDAATKFKEMNIAKEKITFRMIKVTDSRFTKKISENIDNINIAFKKEIESIKRWEKATDVPLKLDDKLNDGTIDWKGVTAKAEKENIKHKDSSNKNQPLVWR